MRTPEKIEKDKVRAYLKEIGAYVFAPVQQGYGQQTVDLLACVEGKFFGIEVKAEGKKPTKRQQMCMREIEKAGGLTICGTADKIIEGLEWSRDMGFTKF